MSLNEVMIFHHAIQNPKFISASLQELNLSSIPDKDIDNQTSQVQNTEITNVQKKAQRMFYRVWSGLTKYLRQVVVTSQRPCEIKDFAIFQPASQAFQHKKSASEVLNSLGSGGIGPLNNMGQSNGFRNYKQNGNDSQDQMIVKVLINNAFVNNCGGTLQIPNGINSKILVFDNEDQNIKERIRGLMTVNLSSLAKVCETDAQTVELITQEIFYAIANLISKGESICLNLKIGKLTIRNGHIMFKQFNVDRNQNLTNQLMKTDDQQSVHSQSFEFDDQSMLGSVYRKDLSVITPSISKFSISHSHRSSIPESFHISNPNPQKGQKKYLGIREKGYQSLNQSPESSTQSTAFSYTPDFKFGKKVYVDNKLSNKEVLEIHLKQMKDKEHSSKFKQDLKLREDKDFLNFVQSQMKRDKDRQQRITDLMKKDFLNFNGSKKTAKQHQIQEFQNQKKMESYNYFPFTYGEDVEKQQESLKNIQKQDLQNYLQNQNHNITNIINWQPDYFILQLTSFIHYNKWNNFYMNVKQSQSTTSEFNHSVKSGKNYHNRSMSESIYNSQAGTDFTTPHLTLKGISGRNKLLIYDDHPQKEAAMKQARERYESYIKSQKEQKQHELKMIQDQSDAMKRIMDQKQVQSQRKNEEVREYLNQQKRLKNDNEKFARELEKEKYNTHFGPEEREEDLKRMQDTKNDQKLFIKEELKKQMKSKQDTVKTINQFDKNFDQLVLESNNIRIEEEKRKAQEKILEQRSVLRETWDTQKKYVHEVKEKF